MLSGTFTVNLDAGMNNLRLTADGSGNTDIFINQPTTATPVYTVPVGTPIDVTGNGGNDSVTADYSHGDPIAGGLSIDTPVVGGVARPAFAIVGVAAGTGSAPNFTLSSSTASGTGLVVSNAAVDDTIDLNGVADLALFPDAGTGTLNVASGSYTFDSDLGAAGNGVNVSVQSGAAVAFGATEHLNSLNIASGATVAMLPAGGLALVTNTLADSGSIDLANNDMIVNAPASSSDVQALAGDVAAGVTGSATQGIVFSSTAATDGMTIGAGPVADMPAPPATLDGQPIPSTAVLARYTVPGDVSLDGTANYADLSTILAHYNHNVAGSPDGYIDGDVNDDGTVNFSDLTILLGHYNHTIDAVTTSVTAGSAFTLAFPTPASGSAVRWDINWGDGNNNSYAGNAPSAAHVYTTAGLYQVQFSAVIDNSGSYSYGSGTGVADTVYTGQSQTVVVSDAGVTATPLTIATASATDIFTVTSDTSNDTIVSRNGTTIDDVATSSILSLSITGGPAYVGINFTAGDPIPVGGIFSDAGRINLSGPHGTDPLVTAGTTAELGGDQITFSPSTVLVDNLDSAGGLITVKGTAIVALPFNGSTPQPVTVLPGAGVIVTGSTTISTLTVDPGGTFRMAESGASLLTVGTLTLDGPDAAGDNGGVLDLSDNDMIARNTPASTINTLLSAGYDGGLWDGAGGQAAILSSAAAADPLLIHALGYSQVGTGTGDWCGTTFDATAVNVEDTVIKSTVYGDANLDGAVNSTDFALYETGVNNGLTGWTNADFTYAGEVTAVDYDFAVVAQDYLLALAAGGGNGNDVTTTPVTIKSDGVNPVADTSTLNNAPATTDSVSVLKVTKVSEDRNTPDVTYFPPAGITVGNFNQAAGTYDVTAEHNVDKGTYYVMIGYSINGQQIGTVNQKVIVK